jgi:uncharacterized protein (TIGR02246 family)
MRTVLSIIAVGCAVVSLSPAQSTEQAKQAASQPNATPRPDDQKAIRAVNEAFVRAYNNSDAKAIVELCTKDAEISDETGETLKGREAISEYFTAAFKDKPKGKMELTPDSLRFMGADAARETGKCRITPANGGSPEINRYTVFFVRENGRWLQDIVQESSDPDMTAHDRLTQLEWMLGDWVDESPDAVVNTTCHWSDDKNFLIREFKMRIKGQPISGGTQRIGWDAGIGGFRSWVFDSDGGHSVGIWTRNAEDQWVIEAEGVLADGRSVAATQVLTFVRDGMARWKSVDRVIDDEPVDDLPEIVLVRNPPKAMGSKKTAR